MTAGTINREEFEHLAIAINTGTNLPSVATPKWTGSVFILIDFCFSACDSFVLYKNDLDGFALYDCFRWSRVALCEDVFVGI